MSDVLTVVARIRAKPGMEGRVREVMAALLAPTRAERGCINYDLHQSLKDPCQFVFYENWTSRKELDEHARSPHIKASGAQLEGLLAEPVEITFWKAVK
jgi:quinol monooxygenase YgiN